MRMKLSATKDASIWALALAGAVVVVLVTLLLFRLPDAALAPATATPLPTLTFKQQNGAGEADFYDPTPLFLPTKWNARPNVLPTDTVREPGDDFHYEAQLAFPVNEARVRFPAKADVPAKAADVLNLWTLEMPFLGMGQADTKAEPLPGRDALVEVVTADDGRQVFTQVVRGMPTPGASDWQPMEFLVAVEPAGLVGLPTPAPNSNTTDIVAYFQNYLAKKLRIGQRLAPGFYRIKVGP
jgi:hypothetical protein